MSTTTKGAKAAYRAAWRAANKEKIKASYAAWCAANPEKVKASALAYRTENPEKVKATKAAYYAANSEKVKARMGAWRAANFEKLKAASAEYRAANPEKSKAASLAWRAANKEKTKSRMAAWRKANREKIKADYAAWRAAKYRTDANFRIACTIRGHLGRIVKAGGVKDATSISYVGCTVAQLRQHLEKQFAFGMTWRNHGEWHIDHIIPLAAFDFAGFPAQIKQAQHYTNLRPVWAAENLRKSDALLHPVQLELIAV